MGKHFLGTEGHFQLFDSVPVMRKKSTKLIIPEQNPVMKHDH